MQNRNAIFLRYFTQSFEPGFCMNQEILDRQNKLLITDGSLKMEKIFIPGYEEVWKVEDSSCALRSYIVVHNTALGPSLGGTRIYPYSTASLALEDALRLSKGMTYKAAVCGVGFGGGKSVIIADPKKEKTPELFQTFGRAVEMLKGRYICAEDVGCGTADVEQIRKSTEFVVGLKHENSSGDPSIYTAFGVFRGIQSTLKKVFGSPSLKGKKIAIQGLGSVGSKLAEFLFWQGADLIVTDVDAQLTKAIAKKFGAKIVSPDEILQVSCDLLSPCAMGAILTEHSIAQLQCLAIAGAANNQLLKDSDGDLLAKKGILYAPDFVINAGGLLNVSVEVESAGYDPLIARQKCDAIFDTLTSIYEIAEKNRITTHMAAISLGDYRLRFGVGKRVHAPVFHHN